MKKVTLTENERGFLYKHGVFVRVLGPGQHWVRTLLGETVVKVRADGELDLTELNLSALRRDPEFERQVVAVDVPDDHLAAHFIDGHIRGVLEPGIHAFWNILHKNTFEIIDITEPEAASKEPVLYMSHVPRRYFQQADVSDGETGLVFYNGVFQKMLPPGQYFFWNHTVDVSVRKVDTRVLSLDVTGQEILTADKVSLRVNFVCTYQVADPLSHITKLQNPAGQLHVTVQLILREFISKYRFDELLKQKDSVGGFVLSRLQEREGEFFVRFIDAGVKDIILPGEIRDIMNTVLVAEKAAQASVITRREETAATKSLLDTAKLMDENATLYKLKELEYLERICDKVGSISVDSGGGILNNLRELVSPKL